MNKTEQYLADRYSKTKWPYYGLIKTKYEIGESFDSDIKELREREMIQPTPGINGWLIELINFEKWKL